MNKEEITLVLGTLVLLIMLVGWFISFNISQLFGLAIIYIVFMMYLVIIIYRKED